MNLSLIDFIPEILDPEDDRFSFRLAERYEFARYGANPTETFPSPGGRFPHQDFAATYFNIYQRALIAHDPGTGKSCLAAAVAETIKRNFLDDVNEGLMMKAKKVYVVAMPTVISNFQKEIVCRCTHNEYYSDDEKSKTVARVNKALGEYYEFMTLGEFKKFLRSFPEDGQRDDELEGATVLIDEAHIFVIESSDIGTKVVNKKIRKEVYSLAKKVNLRVPSLRVIMMTGTPMRNGPNELALLLNLILPANLQFKTEPRDSGIEITKADEWEIWDRFKGNISYLRETKRNFKLNRLGVHINQLLARSLKGIDVTVLPCRIKGFQLEGYYKILVKEGREKVYTQVRQAAIIVYPNGRINSFKKYIEITKSSSILVKDEFKKALEYPRNPVEFINNLSNYSTKFARIAKYIYENPTKKGIIYQEFKFQGVFPLVALIAYGLGMEIVDSDILTGIRESGGFCGVGEFEFDKIANSIGKRPRISFLVPNPHLTNARREALIAFFNSPINSKGEYIKWLVFSPVGREGLSFKDITAIITDVSWSFSIDEQARRRGIRANSHDQIILETPGELEIDIIQLAMDLGKVNNKIPDLVNFEEEINEKDDEDEEDEKGDASLEDEEKEEEEDEAPLGDEEGEEEEEEKEENDEEYDYSNEGVDIFNIDLFMYVRAEEKEKEIRPYRDYYHSMAFDSFVHRRRNQQMDLDDCDLSSCRYDCYTVEHKKGEDYLELVNPLEQDYKMSYEWYWSNPDQDLIYQLRAFLKDYFREFNIISFEKIIQDIGHYPRELIISALLYMAEKMELFENRLGFSCFLAFSNTSVALVPRPHSKFEEYLYYENFRFQIQNDNIKPAVDKLILSEKYDKIQAIFTYHEDYVLDYLVRTSPSERNELLEAAYLKEGEIAELIKNHYLPRTFYFEDLIITTQKGVDNNQKHSLVGNLLKPTVFRVFDRGVWRDPRIDEQPRFEKIVHEEIKEREDHLKDEVIYGFFIIDDPRGLMIRESLTTGTARGIACSDGLDPARRAQIFRYLNVPIDAEIPAKMTIAMIKKTLPSQYTFIDEDDEEEVKYIYRFYLWKKHNQTTSRQECELLAKNLNARGLIVYR